MTSAVDFWWQRVPLAGSRISRAIGRLLGEGIYLTIIPPVAATAPIIAIVLGLLVGWHRLGVEDALTQSPAILMIAIALGLVAAQLGLLFALAYGMTDLLLHRLTDLPRGDINALEYVTASVITYVGLGILAAGVPLAVRALRAQTPLPSETAGDARVAADMLLGGLAAAVLTWLYVSALPMLVRPLFIWQGRNPNLSSIEPAQEGAWQFAIVALVIAAVRVLVEYAAVVVDGPDLERRAAALDAAPPGAWERIPPIIRVTIAALAATVFLAGLVVTTAETLLLFGGLWLIMAARSLGATYVPGWPTAMARIPVVVRFVAALIAGYAVSAFILTDRLRGDSFVPLIIGMFVALLFFALLFPAAARPSRAVMGDAPREGMA